MNRNALSKSTAALGVLGSVASIIGLVSILANRLEFTELTLSVASAVAALLAGLFSTYFALVARKLRTAPRVFVSYSHSDRTIAGRIADALRAGGARVWLDQEHIRPGDDIRLAVERAISDTDTFVALVSQSASPNLAFELGLARAKGIRIIPVLVSGKDVPADLQGFKYLDLRENEPGALGELVKAST